MKVVENLACPVCGFVLQCVSNSHEGVWFLHHLYEKHG